MRQEHSWTHQEVNILLPFFFFPTGKPKKKKREERKKRKRKKRKESAQKSLIGGDFSSIFQISLACFLTFFLVLSSPSLLLLLSLPPPPSLPPLPSSAPFPVSHSLSNPFTTPRQGFLAGLIDLLLFLGAKCRGIGGFFSFPGIKQFPKEP